MHFCRVDADRVDIAMDCRAPFLETLLPLVGAHEIFDLHLLKLAHAENKVARRYLISECLPYLPDTEGQFRMERIYDILKVREYAPRRFRSQVGDGRSIIGRAYLRLEHHVELSHITELSFTLRTFFSYLIGAKTTLALLALDERVLEAGNVPARFPHFRAHEYRGVNAVHVVPLVYEHIPPKILYIVLQLHTKRAVIPCSRETAIYLTPLVDKTAPLRERYYLFHQSFRHILSYRTTVAFVALNPGSPIIFVVTLCTVRVMVCPVAESTPENLMSCRSGGSCPICEVEGVKPIAIADCRGNAPSMPTPGSMLPISHVTPLSFWLKVRFSESGLKMPTHRTYDGRIAVSFAFSILFVVLVSVNTIPYVVSVPALGGRGPTLVNGFA